MSTHTPVLCVNAGCESAALAKWVGGKEKFELPYGWKSMPTGNITIDSVITCCEHCRQMVALLY